MRRLWRCSLSSSSETSATRSYRPSPLALERRTGLAAIFAYFRSTNVNLWWSTGSSSSTSPPWDSCDPRRTISIVVVVVRCRRVRVVLVLASAVVGSRIAGSFGIGIVAGIDHLVVGSIVFDYRRRASCGGGGGVSGCGGVLCSGEWGEGVNVLLIDLRGWPLWPFLKGILASNVPPLDAACGLWWELQASSRQAKARARRTRAKFRCSGPSYARAILGDRGAFTYVCIPVLLTCLLYLSCAIMCV